MFFLTLTKYIIYYMATFISILILLLIFVILISTFFIVAVSDAKVKKK